MEVKNINPNVKFEAKFLDSKSLHQLCEYAVETGRMGKLYDAHTAIDSAYLRTRLQFDFFEKNGNQGIRFTRFIPKKHIAVPEFMEDYDIKKVVEYMVPKGKNQYSFALKKFFEMGKNVNSRAYRKIISE